MTSAPKSASNWPQEGPARTRLRSRTRIPEKALTLDAFDHGLALSRQALWASLVSSGLAERHEAVDIGFRGVFDVGDVHAPDQRILCEAAGQGGRAISARQLSWRSPSVPHEAPSIAQGRYDRPPRRRSGKPSAAFIAWPLPTQRARRTAATVGRHDAELDLRQAPPGALRGDDQVTAIGW